MADPIPFAAEPLRAAAESAEWSDSGASTPWLLHPVDPENPVQATPDETAKLRLAAFCSVGLHFAAVALIVLGLPRVDLDWLKPQDAPIKRIDVVFYDPATAEEVARGTGAVSQEQGHFGRGEAERRGRDIGQNPSPQKQDPTRQNAPRAAEGQGQAGEGKAAAPSPARDAAASGAKADAPQPSNGGARRAAQPPATAGSKGQPDGKAQEERTTAPKQTTPESAQEGGGTLPPRPSTPLASSLALLNRPDDEQPKSDTVAERPPRATAARPQTTDIRPQPAGPPNESQTSLVAPDSAAHLQERLRELRQDGGTSKVQVAAATPVGGAPLLPAAGSGRNPESGSTSNAPPPKTGGSVPPRAMQAMAPQPVEKSSTVAMRLMLQTMPGLDSTLAAAMASPDSVPVLPPTPGREQVIARMKKAADQGYAHAQYGVARRELIGQGVPRDPAAAAELLERAARQGYATAQLALGYMALKGYGVKRDKAEATVWLTLAANQGNEDAARALALIEPTLTAEELIAARRLTSEWKSVMGDAAAPAAAEGKTAPERSPLQDAIAHGDVTAVRTLIARGEDANGRDREGRTAMINAGWRGDTAMVESLLELGADPDIVDNEGRTAIMWAAGNGYPNVVERLIKAGVELDLKDKQGRTALVSAALNGHTDVVKVLVAGKAKLDLRDDRGKTALDYALRQDYPDIVQVLEKVGAKR